MNARSPMQSVISNRNFRLLWLGQSASMLGDQFSFIATPWLVLKLTNDPLVLGTVLALSGIPRAVFMLIGGAITDRFSPRLIMLASDITRLLLTAMMASLVLTGMMQIWMLYVFALLFGLVSGFFTPASSAMVPRLIDQKDIQAGNSLSQGSMQLVNFLGPVLAGGVIAIFTHNQPGASPDLFGVGLAFIIDSLTFLVSIITLWLMERQPALNANVSAGDVLKSIGAGIRYAAEEPFLRTLFILLTLVNFLFIGPLLVGIPVLANTRLVEGAVAFGLIMSAYGGGNLAGILLAGALPRQSSERMRFLLIFLVAAFGVALTLLAFITSTAIAVAMMLFLGVGNGYLAITLISILQQRSPGAMMGRLMSLLMLSSLGLAPLSQALAGVIIRFNMNALFIGSGALMVLFALWMIGRPEISNLSMVSSAESAQ